MDTTGMDGTEGMTGEALPGREAPLPPEPAASPLADRLQAALAEAVAPAWRKAYLSNLIASGRRFADAGNARGSDYCFAKVEEALKALPAAPPAAAAPSPARERPGERIGRQWRLARIDHAERILDSHGTRLSSVEKNAYREKLAKLRHDASQPSQAGRADAGLLDLRRRLYQRVLKAQKVSILRLRAPARPAPPARVSATPTAWHPVTGPYNDRSNLEGLLDVIGAADPAWVEEFLELYGALAGLEGLIAAAGVAKK